MSKILCTGDQGFLGTYLVDRLKELGHEVYGYDIKTGAVFPGNSVDVVFHLASHVNAFESVSYPEQGFDNVQILFNVLEWMRATGSNKIIFSSSREVFSCVNPYGASKLACEAFLRSYCASYGFQAVSCRLANLYGPGNLGFRFIGATITAAQNNDDIVVYGGQDKLLNFLHVRDAAEQMIQAINQLRPNHHEKIEIAYPQSYSLLYLAELIIKLTNSSSRIVTMPNRRGETLSYVPREVRFMPSVTLEEGIKECIEHP